MVLYKKLYDIDRNGLKKMQKKWKPIFQYSKTTMAGNKKHEIIRVAQENLYMLKRLNEKTSVYNVDKWKKDYEASQYYKRSHCQYPSIDFYKTQRCGSFGNVFGNVSKNNTKKNFYSKTQYSNNFNNIINTGNQTRKRKRFEDFSYRDLKIGQRSNSENVRIMGAYTEPVQPYLIEPKITELLAANEERKSTMGVIERIARFHLEFEGIHPFIDGNGRTGRLILNFELIRNGYPPINVKFTDRKKYYDAFDAYYRNGNANKMIELIAVYVNERFDEYLKVLREE